MADTFGVRAAVRGRVLRFLTALAAAFPAASLARADGPVDQAIALANHGDIDGAVRLLRPHVARDRKDVPASVLLGRLLDFDGRPDEAVAVWEAGLVGNDADLPLLAAVGEVRLRQGNDGPGVTYRRGAVSYQPTKDRAKEVEFQTAHLALAASAFEKASKLRPDSSDLTRSLAAVYEAQNRFDAAAELWRSLVALEPKDASRLLGLALAVQKAGRVDEAGRLLEQTIALNPRLAAAHAALADVQQKKGQTAQAEHSRKRAAFYEHLPAFCSIDDTEENVRTLETMNTEETFRKLVADPSPRADEFLAVLCWSHPHDDFETRAYEALEARGERTTKLLRGLLASARSTCTIRSTAHILARRKVEGLFEDLERMLPGDLRGFGMDMDVAGSLDDLGDPRAVPLLAQVFARGDNEAEADQATLTDRGMARARAAMALGAFDTPEVRQTLEAGTRDPRLAPYCLAALYRSARNPDHLEALKKAAGADQRLTRRIIARYLDLKVRTEPARALATKWTAELDAAEKTAPKP